MKFKLFLTITLISLNVVLGQAKLHIGIYYESLCPDSIRFIANQLVPEYPNFAHFIDIEFVPFGKSASAQTGNSVAFTCQHGPQECEGNKIQSCALNSAISQLNQVQFVACQMTYGADESGQSCAEQAGIPYESVQQCYNSNDGTTLQLNAEKRTQTIAHPRSMLAFVPTIVYNHEFDPVKQNRSLKEFRNVICEELQNTTVDLPAVCLK